MSMLETRFVPLGYSKFKALTVIHLFIFTRLSAESRQRLSLGIS